MIIDVHYHLMPSPERKYEDYLGFMGEQSRLAKAAGIKIDDVTLARRAAERYPDLKGDKLIKWMNEAGIDFTCVNTVDNVENEERTEEFAQMVNKRIADIANKYPDRLMAFAGIDPRRENALNMLKQCFEEYGMKGLKYHCDSGYNPNSPESIKILKYLEKKGGILLTHTGPLGPPAQCKYTEPILLSETSNKLPNLKIIGAHMGSAPKWREWAALAAFYPNLYGDMAMWQAYAFGKYELFCRELRDLIDYAGLEKVMFASDGPVYDIVIPTKNYIQLIQNLPKNAPKGIKFTEEEVEAILGNNAAKFLGISKP
ncbi:MAG: amidohydrolase family protein [Candidatus Hodarchaeales archaeon]|jgi:predicted TIM-barrel fold metal-dependent hydrolase